MKKQLAWILGGGAIVGLGMLASMSACSSDSTTTDSGTKDQTSSDTNTKDQVVQDVIQNDAPADAGADCKTVPSNAPFTTDAGPFCPFQGDGGVFAACDNGQHCCVPGSGASTCQDAGCVFAADAATNADFQCQETNDCPANNVCCENAGSQVQQDLGCTAYDFVSKQKGTSCVQGTACGAGQGQVCGSTADCSGGKTCFPLNTKGIWLGVCIGSDGGI